MSELSSKQKLGIALVGLGKYSEEQLGPALKETKHCFLAGVVSGSDEKISKWQSQYNLKDQNVYRYETFEEIARNKEVDIIYVVLPNSLHKEWVVRAAAAGKHVICEKPMALNTAECDEMIAACEKAGVMLSIGYRLHFDPFNQEMMRLGQQQVFGKVQKVIADNGLDEVEGWRLNKELAGGGPLMDVGIYCIQGVCYTTGSEPKAVTAREGEKTDPKRFNGIEENLFWQMEMEDGTIAECKTSYTKQWNLLRAEAEHGWFQLSPAYEYKGLEGRTSKEKMQFQQINQQAAQMDNFAQAIKEGRPSPVPGAMGKRDVAIIEAIYEAMRSGKKIPVRKS